MHRSQCTPLASVVWEVSWDATERTWPSKLGPRRNKEVRVVTYSVTVISKGEQNNQSEKQKKKVKVILII